MISSDTLLTRLFNEAFETAVRFRNEIVEPEHLLFALCRTEEGRRIIESRNGDYTAILSHLNFVFFSRAQPANHVPIVGEDLSSLVAVFITSENEQKRNPKIHEILVEMIERCNHFKVMGMALLEGNLVTRLALSESEIVEDSSEEEDEEIDFAEAMFREGDDEISEEMEKELQEMQNQSQDPPEDSTERKLPGTQFIPQMSPAGDQNFAAMIKSLRDLGEMAQAGKIDPVIGRNEEISSLVNSLRHRRKPNVLLVGDPGVGKTALVEGLATRIAAGLVPEGLANRKIFEVSMTSMMSGTKYRGDFEARLNYLVEFATARNAIIFIDEGHVMVGTGGGNGSGGIDAGNILKPALSRGLFSVILATTAKENRILQKDKALSRRFQRIDVAEPSRKTVLDILENSRKPYEDHHGVTFDENALKSIVDLATTYMPERRFPDKAFDVMDHAAVIASSSGNTVVSQMDVNLAIQEMTGTYPGRPSPQRIELARNFESRLMERIFGQQEALVDFSRQMRLAILGMGQKSACASAHLFNGPTGTGKTETAKAAADILGVPLIRIDMSEYMESHSVSGLIGAPPGYIGHDEDGVLIAAAEANPSMVLLLDEVDKAHPKVFDLLLQIMDNGRLTSSDGRMVSFRASHIIMTANLGAQDSEKSSIGFGRKTDEKEVFNQAVSGMFRKEFIERLSSNITFKPLGSIVVRKIISKTLVDFSSHFNEKGISIDFDETVVDLVLSCLGEKTSGRTIQRIIAARITDSIALDIISDMSCSHFRVSVVGDRVVAHPVPSLETA